MLIELYLKSSQENLLSFEFSNTVRDIFCFRLTRRTKFVQYSKSWSKSLYSIVRDCLRRFARFVAIICTILTSFHGCFSRFLNCTNGTKSCKASHLCHLNVIC